MNIDPNCMGIIVDTQTGARIGSGFIIDEPKTVITARHVAIDLKTGAHRQLGYLPPGLPGATTLNPTIKLSLVKDLENSDIAVLNIQGDSPCKNFWKRSAQTVKTGDMLIYAGLSTAESGFKVSAHPVKRLFEENLVSYIEIEGEARPGYSGGPVLDRSGVVGIVVRGVPRPGNTLWTFDAIAISEVPK